MNIEEQFNEAVAGSKLLPSKPDNETLLKLYSLYKQATEGDNKGEAPANPFDIVAKAKYNAWTELKGKGKEDAMSEYVGLVNELKGQ
jgi:diazepam-binding inhibitor (GABA receptor modulator, acyl-CoA-binding protein)